MTTDTQRPEVRGFFHEDTNSVAYVVWDPATKQAATIDAVLHFDEKSGKITTGPADEMLAFIEDNDLELAWILDTHPHADHLMASAYLKELTGATTAIGEKVTDVQKIWKAIYGLSGFHTDGSQWDRLFADGDTFALGDMEVRVMHSPGHTLASVTYIVGDAAFIHDTLFMPDFGTARADFPGGDADALFDSIVRILELPAETRLFTGHDYMPGGREPRWESTVEEQRNANVHLQAGLDRERYTTMRRERDATLALPRLMLHALQVNIRGGRIPKPEDNGRSYLLIPLDHDLEVDVEL